jgi:DNA transposition AAA+ family ATPase
MDTLDKICEAEVTDLARRIHAWQERGAIKTPALIRDFRGIGSEKTYRDLRNGNLDGYDCEQQLANYRAVWAEIEARDSRAAEEPVYDDLSAVQSVRLAALRAMRNTGINRVVIVLGGSGIGKSAALQALSLKYGSRVLRIEALEVWGDRPGELLGAILTASGASGLPITASERFARAAEFLRRTRRCLAIDEAHHMGPKCINTIKALVNATPGEFLLFAMATLWHKLEGAAYQEARQISTNRLSERIRLALTNEDVTRYLHHAFPHADATALKAGASLIRPAAENAGNFLFVRDVCEQTRDMISDTEKPTAQVFADAVKAVSARR